MYMYYELPSLRVCYCIVVLLYIAVFVCVCGLSLSHCIIVCVVASVNFS